MSYEQIMSHICNGYAIEAFFLGLTVGMLMCRLLVLLMWKK